MLEAANRTERLVLADLFESLDASDFDTPSLCHGWSVGDVLAHLATPMLLPASQVALTALRRGSVSDAMVDASARVRERPLAEQLDALRRSAERPFTPPMLGIAAPLTDVVVHGDDVRVPLSLDHDVPLTTLRVALDLAVDWRAAPVFVPFRRFRGLRLVATDLDWEHGSGEVVRGPARQLVRAAFGRIDAAPDLAGDGLDRLRSRS
jgi:uncharacterized protein (TIGR03083 family)